MFSQLVNTDTFIGKKTRDAFVPDEMQGADDDKVILIVVQPG